ncbi:TatD family hydrolase [Adlercreutzia sp. R25]|uniref:TatD family hydrolase n=1 Tax=Adlercreutzia shanghongiae TaxID=3111773 RepID=UPI002DB8EA77|nr:TatD family hydrolase [Adlercreutzia sp. R25]MEC4271673.1 TatD family hydrolase [Adlercreutzia sp. R25]
MLGPMEELFDMHCHLGFTPNPAAAAEAGQRAGIGALSCTVEPAEYERLSPLLTPCENVQLGLGAHPWWIADGRISAQELESFCAQAPTTSYIGEIGLDFSGARDAAESRMRQTQALERILRACNKGAGEKLLSLHAVNAASVVLDLLEEADAFARHQVVFHWFSGTSGDMARTVRAGGFFSVGPRMLASRRGRAYARQIPLDRLLLETDMPSRAGDPLPAGLWRAELGNALAGLSQLKELPTAEVAERLAETSRRLLEL